MKIKLFTVLIISGLSSFMLVGCNKNDQGGMMNNESSSGRLEVVEAVEVVENVTQTGMEIVIDTETGVAKHITGSNVVEEDSDEEIQETADNELQATVEKLVEERKETLGDSDSLTEEDIQLIEDILDELIKAVE